MSSNWNQLKQKLKASAVVSDQQQSHDPKKRKFLRMNDSLDATKLLDVSQKQEEKARPSAVTGADLLTASTKAKYVGLDCEMVGIGPNGKHSALARCCLVDFDGEVLYDEFVRPKDIVTDFRTKYSGVRKKDLRTDRAVTFAECQEAMSSMISGKILVGHALKNDLDVLMLSHPRLMIRDTARYRPYMRPSGRGGGKFKPRALKDLTQQHLKKTIQTGEHDPGEDARCAMELYKLARKEWEDGFKKGAGRAKPSKPVGKSALGNPSTGTGAGLFSESERATASVESTMTTAMPRKRNKSNA